MKSVLLTVWAAGSAAVALFFIISGTRFRLRLKRSGRETDDFREVPVYISGCVSVPIVVGVFRPVIYIPEITEDEKARELILTHEYIHLRHGDQLWSFMRMLAIVFHWWNPLVWVSAIMSKRDSELACDDSVASRLSREDRYYYARLLLESIPMKRPFALGFGSVPIKERIFMLTDNFKNRSRAVLATVLLLSFAFCAFGCSFASAAVDGSGKGSDNANGLDKSEASNSVNGTDVQWSGWTIERFIDSSSCVFYGKCISRSLSDRRQKLDFEIEEVFKGKYDPQISGFIALNSISFKVGNNYLLFCGVDASVYSGEDHYGISAAVCDNDDGLYHEGIVNLNLSTLDNVRDYVKHYITDHPTDNEVPFNNDYCRSDDLREVYDYASAVIVAKIIGITDNSNKDRTSYSFEVKEILKGNTGGESWVIAFKDSMNIGEEYILLLDKPEKTSLFFKMCSPKSIIPTASEEAALIRSFSG